MRAARGVRQEAAIRLHDSRKPGAKGAARITCGDAYDLIGGLPKHSIDLILTSPPYWGHRTYDRNHNWSIHREWLAAGHPVNMPPPYQWYREHGGVLGLEPQWYVCHLVEFFDRAAGCLKPRGSMWINLGDTYFARWSSIRENGRQGLGDHARQRRRTPMGGYRQEKQLLLVPARFAIAMEDRRWILRNDMIWYKPNVPPRPEVDRLKLSHEHFFHFVKRPKAGRASYYYDMSHVEERSTDVVTCNVRPGENGHTATFPLELIRPRSLSSCPPRGVALDPFCGTGRSLAVAVEAGRDAVGFEMVPEYAAAARELANPPPTR